MLNKKGFTLLEVIIVIALIGIVAIIVGISISNGSKNAKKTLLDNKIKNIESAAVVYAQENKEKFTSCDWIDNNPCEGIDNCYCYKSTEGDGYITVGTLIDNGVLTNDQNDDDILNPLTKMSLSDEKIIIYQKYNKIYAYIKDVNTLYIEDVGDAENSGDSGSSGDADDDTGETSEDIILKNFKSETLAYHILSNAINASGDKTVYGTPLTTVGEVSIESERVLATAEDNGGTSYYFRGNIVDNYVSFANKCWRIVRIESDGAIKLVLIDNGSVCDSSTLTKSDSAFIGFGMYSTNITFDFENSSLKTKLNNWYSSDIASYSSKLKNDIWCLGGNTLTTVREEECDVYYENGETWDCSNKSKYYNTTINSFKCDNNEGSYEGKYGLLTASEVIFAGACDNMKNVSNINPTKNTTYYLYNNAYSNYWYTLSRAYQENSNNYVFSVYDGEFPNSYFSSGLTYSPLTAKNAIRPSIVLNKDVKYKSGNGFVTNAYEIK